MWLLVAAAHAAPPEERPEDRLQVAVGKSVVLTLSEAPLAVAVTDPSVAAVQPLGSATVLQVQGRKLGTTDLVLTFASGEVKVHDVEVGRDVSDLVRVIDRIVEGPPPKVDAAK